MRKLAWLVPGAVEGFVALFHTRKRTDAIVIIHTCKTRGMLRTQELASGIPQEWLVSNFTLPVAVDHGHECVHICHQSCQHFEEANQVTRGKHTHTFRKHPRRWPV